MMRIGILGDIGSGKSYVARNFGYPVFNADHEVAQLYQQNRKIFISLKKSLPKFFHSFPIKKEEISNAILANKNNLNKIVKIVHTEIRKKMNLFLKKNKNKKIVILDIPLLLENNINKKRDILIFVQSKQSEIIKKLKKRNNFNQKLFNRFKKIQLPLGYKKKKAQFVIKNNFTKKNVNVCVRNILNKIL